jgi:uncharacterized protein with WD repeat
VLRYSLKSGKILSNTLKLTSPAAAMIASPSGKYAAVFEKKVISVWDTSLEGLDVATFHHTKEFSVSD